MVYTPFKIGQLIVVQETQLTRALQKYELHSNLYFGMSGQWREDELMLEAGFVMTPAKQDWDAVDRIHGDGQYHDTKIALTNEEGKTAASHTIGKTEVPDWIPHVEAGGDVLISSWIQLSHHGIQHKFMGLLSFKTILNSRLPDGRPMLIRKSDGSAYFFRKPAYDVAMIRC